MLFIDCDINTFAERNKLKTKAECNFCMRSMKAINPFYIKGYAGFFLKCECGHSIYRVTPRDDKQKSFWKKILFGA